MTDITHCLNYKTTMNKMRGFSLIEMIIAVAILALLAAAAVPNFRDMIASSRQTSVANQFIGSFHMARNEAITRSTNITVAAGIDGDGNQDWTNGWTIMTADGVTTIAVVEPLTSGTTITEAEDEAIDPPPPLSFQYNRAGRLAFVDGAPMAGTETLTICDKRTGETGRQISIEPIGRASVSTITCK